MIQLSEHQPHIVVTLPDAVHVLALSDIRRLAAGLPYLGDKDIIIQILAQAVKGLSE